MRGAHRTSIVSGLMASWLVVGRARVTGFSSGQGIRPVRAVQEWRQRSKRCAIVYKSVGRSEFKYFK